MRKAIFIGGTVVAAIAMMVLSVVETTPKAAFADNGPHVATGSDATPDKCAGCHRIHTGKNEYLLKEAGTIEQFCFSCHGNGGPGSDLAAQEGTYYGETTAGPPYGGKTASTTVGLRAGGFDEARIDTTDPSAGSLPETNPSTFGSIGVLAAKEAVVSRHAVDGTVGTMWGNGPVGTAGVGPSFTLECTSCHDPHGNGNYRILRTVPTGSGAAGYAVPDTYPKAGSDYTTTDYLALNYGPLPGALPVGATPAPGVSILVDTSKWCAQCHTRYLATRRAPLPADRSKEDSGDPVFTFRHTSSGWRISSSGVPSFTVRACITCHASHGSNAQMTGAYSSTVEWPDGSTTNPANDLQRSSLLKMDNRGICRKCHDN